MPIKKPLPQLVTRLAEPDMIRFREIALTQDLSHSELLRAAALFYMDNYQQARKNEIESVYAQQRKADTNRICALMAKIGVEVHTIIEFLRRMEGGPEVVQDCMSVAAKRLDKLVETQAEKVKQQMQKVVDA